MDETDDFGQMLFPRQADAYRSAEYANEQFFGGAKGGGKSGLIRLASIMWAFDAPGVQQYLFRRHYRELQNNHMEGPGSYPDLLRKLIKTDQVFITAHEIRFLPNCKKTGKNCPMNNGKECNCGKSCDCGK